MTTPDIAGLSNKLRCRATTYNVLGGHYAYIGDDCALDDRAADTLERQAAEIERLRGALEPFNRQHWIGTGDGHLRDDDVIDITLTVGEYRNARAALTGEDAVPVKLHD
jgi:hypothetical protein